MNFDELRARVALEYDWGNHPGRDIAEWCDDAYWGLVYWELFRLSALGVRAEIADQFARYLTRF